MENEVFILPESNVRIVSIVWDLDTDTINVNWEGLSRFEAVGILDAAIDAVKDAAFEFPFDYDEGEDEDE